MCNIRKMKDRRSYFISYDVRPTFKWFPQSNVKEHVILSFESSIFSLLTTYLMYFKFETISFYSLFFHFIWFCYCYLFVIEPPFTNVICLVYLQSRGFHISTDVVILFLCHLSNLVSQSCLLLIFFFICVYYLCTFLRLGLVNSHFTHNCVPLY